MTHKGSLGRPGRRPCPGSKRVRRMAASRLIPKAPPPVSGTSPTTVAPSASAILLIFLAIICLTEWKRYFQVIPINHQPDGPLPRLFSHVHEELPQPGRLGLQECLGGITIDHDGLVKHQPTALGIVAPYALALRKGGRPAKEFAQGFQCPVYPRLLVNGLGIAVHTGDEQDEQGAFGLRRAQLLSEGRSEFGHEIRLE